MNPKVERTFQESARKPPKVFSVIPRTDVGRVEGLTALLVCSRRILLLQPTSLYEKKKNRIEHLGYENEM